MAMLFVSNDGIKMYKNTTCDNGLLFLGFLICTIIEDFAGCYEELMIPWRWIHVKGLCSSDDVFVIRFE